MKHLGSFIVVAIMSLFLTACGQQAPKQPDVKIEVQKAPAEAVSAHVAPAAPAEAAPTEAAPAQ